MPRVRERRCLVGYPEPAWTCGPDLSAPSARAALRETTHAVDPGLSHSTHEDRVGALTLFSHDSNAFDNDDIDKAVAIAAPAAAAEEIARANLHVALDNRTLIGQATGLVMDYYGLSAGQSFQVLRRLSNERNVRIAAISQEMVTQHERDREAPLRQPRTPRG